MLEAIITHPASVDPATLEEIKRYTKLFWINSGPHNNLTARKFVLKLTPAALAAAARAAAQAGAVVSAEAAARRSISCWPGSSRCSSIPNVDSDRHRQDAAAGHRTSSPRAPTTCTPASR